MNTIAKLIDPRWLPIDPIMVLWPAHSWATIALATFLVWAVIAFLLFRPRPKHVARLKGLVWKRSQFCRGWLITGDTGSGKTSSGINQLAHQVFQNEPKWGGLCIDEKGIYWETLKAMAEHYGRSHDLIHVQIRPDNDFKWAPQHRFNLVGDRAIPFSTYAKFVVDTATSLGQGGDEGFFKSQAQTHIAHPFGFEKIPLSEETKHKFFADQLHELELAIREQRGHGNSRLVKQLEAAKKRLETRLRLLAAEHRKDNTLTFEELGVDRLFID